MRNVFGSSTKTTGSLTGAELSSRQASTMDVSKLKCPKCGGLIHLGSSTLSCSACKTEVQVENGIIDFEGDQGVYLGELPLNDMLETLRIAGKQGYVKALEKMTAKFPNLSEYVLSDRRADWLLHCLNSYKRGSCLDIGSGWGTIAFQLARWFDVVWSLETVRDRIMFQAVRAAQSSTDVRLVRAKVPPLPFGSGQFDLVVANGALEWAGYLDTGQDPKKSQTALLAEAFRVLKDGGCLYLGIENRFGLEYFLGARDHSGLPFTSLLPRRLADVVAKLFAESSSIYDQEGTLPRGYRVFTHSLLGYARMLRAAGFDRVDTYWAYPGYNEPAYSGKIPDGNSIRLFFERCRTAQNMTHLMHTATRVGCQMPLSLLGHTATAFWPNFLIYAYKGGKRDAFEPQLMRTLDGDGFLALSSPFSYSYHVAKNGRLLCVAKIRLRETSCTITEEHSLLKQFGNVSEAKLVRQQGHDILVTPRLDGMRFDPFNQQHHGLAMSWLRDFQRETERRSERTDTVREAKELDSLVRQLSFADDLKAKTLGALSRWLDDTASIKLPPAASHGDFWAENMIVSRERRLFVLDWEHFRAKDNPLFDPLFFVLTNSMQGADPRQAFLNNFLGTGEYSTIMTNTLNELCRARNIDAKVALGYLPFVMIRYLKRHAYGSGSWIKQFDTMKSVLSTWHEIFPNRIRLLHNEFPEQKPAEDENDD